MTIILTGEIIRNIELTTISINFIAAIIGIIIGLLLVTRFAGKLKLAAISLVIAISFFILYDLLNFLNLNGMFSGKPFMNIIHTIIIIFILTTLILTWKAVIKIDNQTINQKSNYKSKKGK